MPEKVHRLHILADDATDTDASDTTEPAADQARGFPVRGLDRLLSVQRPLVVAHLRGIRLNHPEATPQQIVRILETRYLAAVTTGGAAVGATAVIPGIGTGITLALSGAETVGFMESTALFAQSVAEVHGVALQDPERARALVMALLLGEEGIGLVSQLTAQAAGRGGTRSSYWGELLTKQLPRAAVGPLADRLRSAFIRQFASRGGASFLGKALPFGVGAVIGGAGNHLLGRRVLSASRRAFGAGPARLPAELEPVESAERFGRRMLRSARTIGAGIGDRAMLAAGAARTLGRRPRADRSPAPEADSPSTTAE